MPLHVDHRWHFAGGAATREKRVYRDGRLIGRVRRWQMIELSGRHRSWFTVEQWQSDSFHPVGAMHTIFDEAPIYLVSIPLSEPTVL